MGVGDRDNKVDTDWQSSGASFSNLLMGMVPDCKGDLVSPDLFGQAPTLWDHPANSHSMGFNSINDHGIFNPAQFPADSAFIERAARFSCFSTGNITDMVNSFGLNQPVNAYHQVGMMSGGFGGSKLEKKNGGLVEETKQSGSDTVNSGGQEETSLIDSAAQPSSAKRIGTKRKRGAQNTQQPRQPLGEDVTEAPMSNNGENGKQSSETLDPPKEEYIHVRARRGQATNSHSLAERVRREKISERMKFLQDLVPGCNKVTGKAVMLDEIINYVQSLQRQVEFLSMKLATVNPRLDINIESLLAKDQMFAARSGPSTMGLPPDMPLGYPHLHPSQPMIIQPNHPVMSSQIHNLWDDELHNVVQMGFNSSTSPENHDTNFQSPGKTKVEL